MKPNILITGGLGFIGSHLYERLKDDYSITILDNFTNNKINEVDCELIIGDIRTFRTDEVFDYVIHLAAIASISPEFNPELYSVNVAGFENIYRHVKTNNFIYASSAAAINKANHYGITKAINEHTAKDSLGLRFFNVYGKRDNGVVGKLCKGNGIVFGGNQTRDFIHVNDITNFIARNLDRKGLVELGTGIETPIKELAKIIGKPFSFSTPKEYEEQRSVCFNPINCNYKLKDGIKEVLL